MVLVGILFATRVSHSSSNFYVVSKPPECELNSSPSYLLSSGGDLREQGEARGGAVPPVGGLQLPFDLHPQPAQAGGAHCSLQGLQGLLQAHPCVHRSLRQR